MRCLFVVCCTSLLLFGCSAGDDAFKRELADSFRRIADVVEEELRGSPIKPPIKRPVEPPVEPPFELPVEPPVVPVVELPVARSDEPVVELPVAGSNKLVVEPPDQRASAPVGEPLVELADDADRSLLTPAAPPIDSCPPPKVCPDPRDEPTYWQTDEYVDSHGLPLINASAGYAYAAPWVRIPGSSSRLGGDGITVMVLDDGVDISHPDLRLSARGGMRFEHDFMIPGDEPPRSHGTQVAGVIAARKNWFGVQGVAYNAEIVSMGRCDAENVSEGECNQADDFVSSSQFIAAGIASAAGLNRTYSRLVAVRDYIFYKKRYYSHMHSNPDASADIINMSFGFYNDNVPHVSSAMRDAAAAGRIMVAALGNDGAIGPMGAPASNVADPGIAGYAIGVGSLNRDGTGKANHSNTCGPVAEYCLFAPGESILTTTDGGGYEWNSGTSFAAPHVSGAAAVVWAVFPNKSADEIVLRLLATANRSDVFGDSSIYGYGALDLGAALAPIDRGRGLTVGGSTTPLIESYVALPPGFSAPARSTALANTIVYDAQMFPFYYDLSRSFRVSNSSAEGTLRGFLSSLGKSSNVSLGGANANLHFMHSHHVAGRRWDALEEDDQNEELDIYRFSVTLVPGVRAIVGQGFGSIGASNNFIAARTNRTIFADAFSVAPFAAFAGRGPELTLDWQVDDSTTVDLVSKDGRGYGGSSSAQLASLGLTHEIGDGVTLGVRYGKLWEKGSMMGVRTAGAFASNGRATTDFVDISMEGRVSDDLSLFGSISHGITGSGTHGVKNSLVSEWSTVRAESFVIGAESRRLLQGSDRLTATFSSPFRADRATIHMDVPDREMEDMIVGYTRRAIDLVPGGREYRIQWVYEMTPDASWLGFGRDAVSAAMGSYVRMEAHHDKTSDPEFGAAVKIRASF